MPETAASFEPETLSVLKTAFDETCAALPPELLTQSTRAFIAECILQAAAKGERDAVRLRNHALLSIDRAE
jgi:hypothetical protein